MTDADDKFRDYINLKDCNVAILITFAIKDDAKLFPETFLEEAFCNE